MISMDFSFLLIALILCFQILCMLRSNLVILFDSVYFEEVVKLDTQYIREWSVKEDMKILFKTITGVLKSDGAV